MTDNTAFTHGFRDKTRGGHLVRDVHRTHHPDFPFAAEFNFGEGWHFLTFKENGFWFNSEDDWDLIPILTPEQIADGWKLHIVGKQPVADDVRVEAMLRSDIAGSASAAYWFWGECGKFTIIAYRPEPVEIDITKPLELADGTKVGNAQVVIDSIAVELISGPSCGLPGGRYRAFKRTGEHCFGDLPNLRNVNADPLADAIALIEAHGKMVVDGPTPAEPDWERYRRMKDAYLGTTDPLPDPISQSGKRTIERLLAARDHDPDVVAMVRAAWWAWRARGDSSKRERAFDGLIAALAPFAAIKDE